MTLKSSWTPEYNQSDMVKRPMIRDYLAAQNACYEKEHGFKAGSSIQKYWKKAFRKMHHIKDCTRYIHNLTRSNTMSIKGRIVDGKVKPIMPNKPVKAKSEGGNPHIHKEHMENWNQCKRDKDMEKVENRPVPKAFQSMESILEERKILEKKRNQQNEALS